MFFEKKYETPVSNFRTIEEIDNFIQEKTGKKLEYKRSDNAIMAKGGSVFKLTSINSGKKMDKLISK
ncbi:hypothetical protein [Methanoplanus endosymbiosus]|uniref:Uncharacterized protein n=1 Tax=Methanoplanus endosymbiosus TaxID=33865 RepID=A0A9E7TJW1_9EURY|nr:hypothetical protein [Methanoplanus endosymbiosus]UUX92219.1 hypothetical protein L6E24_12815 [Methanoplanus endosymbiosus]